MGFVRRTEWERRVERYCVRSGVAGDIEQRASCRASAAAVVIDKVAERAQQTVCGPIQFIGTIKPLVQSVPDQSDFDWTPLTILALERALPAVRVSPNQYDFVLSALVSGNGEIHRGLFFIA